MRAGATAMAIAALALGAAGPTQGLVNGDFEQVEAGGAPTAWNASSSATVDGQAAYQYGSAPDGRRGRGVILRRTEIPSTRNFGSVSQAFDAAPYRGKKIRYRAWVRTQPTAQGWAGLWMRVDLPGQAVGFFDNMADRPITAGVWQAYEIEGYVSRKAERILTGLILQGGGSAWIDDASVEVIDADLDTTGASLSPAAKAYLDAALDELRAKHINSGKVDWAEVRADAYAAADGARTPAQTYGAIETAVGLLGEKHSFFDRPRPPPPPPAPGAAPGPGVYNHPPTGELRGPIGVVVVPALVTRTPEEMAWGETYSRTLHDLLAGQDKAGACGWIVDLRGNGGGNMWPMLNGLAPILGDGPYGAFVAPGGGKSRWVMDRGRIVIEGTQDAPWTFPVLRARAAPVAVLIGPQTVSSGEMTAVAFRGRPNTRFFGQPTGAFTTANTTVDLPDGAMLAITTAFIEDRNGTPFTGAVPPDESVALEAAEAAAMTWLATQGCSR